MRTDPVWDGITRAENPNNYGMQIRQQLADCTKTYNWPRALAILSEHPQLVNATRPGGRSLYAPLHQAAHGGAPVKVIDEMLKIGAWRTLQNARGERPVDIARKRAHHHLIPILEPQLKQDVPLGILLKLQSHFHRVIRGRADHLVDERTLRLPELEPLLEMEKGTVVWFAIPGMYGGFAYRLERAGVDPLLVAESWCRVVDGSGQRHEVTPAGSRLVEEGFV
ncbi:MAG: ankyrin repeat domain-containing protein [Actinomycetota bacterium]|nr:ankyrin repeat domain-containing protein [Actinomycetota bacterium]